MVKRIDRLTPAQVAQMGAWRDKWIRIGLSTEPMTHGDRWEVDQAIRAMYRKARLPEPKTVLFLPSPFALRVAAGIAAGAIYALRERPKFVDDAVDDAVRDAVDDAVRGAVGDAVGGNKVLVKFLLFCADAAWRQENYWGWWVAGCAWASFFRDICDLQIAEWDTFAALETTQVRAGHPYSLHADFAFVCDRPREIRRNAAGRLHCAEGPAISWRDGWKLYYWHGLLIPRSREWIIDRPGEITPEKIEAESNAELRRVMLERFGFDRYCAARDARVISQDELHGEIRRLLEVRVAREPVRIIEVVNGSLEPDGSRRKFHLGALPGNTPHEAIAASYGINPLRYREAVRT